MANKNQNKNKNAVVRTLTLPDGRRKYFYGATEKEAESKRDAFKIELAGGLIPDDDTTFGEVAKVWLEKYKAPFLRPSSLQNLRSQVNTHLMPHLAQVRVRDITPLICQNVLAVAVRAEYSHVGQIQSYLFDILAVAVELGCIVKSPLQVKRRFPSKKKRGEKVILPQQLQRQIMDELRPLSNELLFFTIGIETGMRRGEILALDWKHIDLQRRTIRVCQQLAVEDRKFVMAPYTKTDAGCRLLPITPPLYEMLHTLSMFRTPTGLLFRCKRTHFTRSAYDTLWGHIRAACALYDSEYAENFTSHVLRHTYVTRLFEAGLDLKEVQALAGHKDVSTTLGTYTHFDEQTRQEDTFEKVRSLHQERPSAAEIIPFPVSV